MVRNSVTVFRLQQILKIGVNKNDPRVIQSNNKFIGFRKFSSYMMKN